MWLPRDEPGGCCAILFLVKLNDDGADALRLEQFIPYRLSVLSNTVSEAIAKLYEDRFGLSMTEWRVLAVAGRFSPVTATTICQRTAMSKVAVSRALSALLARRFVKRDDGRRSLLRPTARGYKLIATVTPLALGVEEQLLDVLSVAQYRQLDVILTALSERAAAL